MKLSENQAQVMFTVLRESCRVYGGFAGFTNEYLQELVENIYNQQNQELVDLEKEEVLR